MTIITDLEEATAEPIVKGGVTRISFAGSLQCFPSAAILPGIVKRGNVRWEYVRFRRLGPG